MMSRTSCFNKTLYRKNLTRFAPVGVLYLLCLMLVALLCADSTQREFWFASHLISTMPFMAVVNLCFAPLIALLLFGDLYNSRMCNGLHAMPVRRDQIFVTNLLSGLTFSLVPTAVMSLVCLPVLAEGMVTQGWQIAWYWFLGTNLQFVCCFGIAVLSVFCAGSWYAMLAVYGGIQFASPLLFLILDCFYVKMLPGVDLTGWLIAQLSPIWRLLGSYMDLQSYRLLQRIFYGREEEMVASFTLLPDTWKALGLWALAGVALAGLGWLLYRKRNLECARDPISLPRLVPVVQVVFSLALGFGVALVFQALLDRENDLLIWLVLLASIAVSWFAVKMALCRSNQVFRKRNILPLLPVLLAVVLSLAATHWDILGIAQWVPRAEQVRCADIYVDGESIALTDPEDISAVLRLHRASLQAGIPREGYYKKDLLEQDMDLEQVYDVTHLDSVFDTDSCRYALNITLSYDLTYGRTARRTLRLWADSEEAQVLRTLLSDWDTLYTRAQSGTYDGAFPFDVTQAQQLSLYVDGYNTYKEESISPELGQSLLDALKADCLEGNLLDIHSLHQGHFEDEDGMQSHFYLRMGYPAPAPHLYEPSIYFYIYPDCTHTLAWLQEQGLLLWDVVLTEE